MKRPVLRYHGGKYLLAPWIIEAFPPHRIYVEPFGGAGSVLMQKPRSRAEVYNDKWQTVVDVFSCLRDPHMSADLERRLRLTPYARDEFFGAYALETDDLVERARKTIVRSFMGFGSAATNGEFMTGFRSNSRPGGSTPAQEWREYPDAIAAFTARLAGVVIENLDAADVIARYDDPDALIYVDPPYPHGTRNMRRGNVAYAHDLADEDHERLAQVLHACAGMVVLSGYRCELYERLFGSWERRDVQAFADGRGPRVECLWLNDAAASHQRQGVLL